MRRRPLLLLLVALVLDGCSGTTEPSTRPLTGVWRSVSITASWEMTLYENRQGTVSGTATYVAAAVCGCDASYTLSGTHDETGVNLTLFRVSFLPSPSFSGVLVHRDTLRGTFDGGGTWDFLRP